MSVQPPEWRSHLHTIVLHPTAPSLLMLSSESGWILPQVTIRRRIWFLHLGWVTQAVREQLGLFATALRYLSLDTDEVEQKVTGIYELTWHTPSSTPPLGGAWVDRNTLANFTLGNPEQRPLLEAYLVEVETGIMPTARPAWAQPGWYETVHAWIETELEQQGYSLMAPPEQIRVWGVSCVLRTQTAQGDFYFKQGGAFPFFAHEPQLTVTLAARFPEIIPTPTSVNLDARWLLLPDIGEPFWAATDDELRDAFLQMGQIQVVLAGAVDDLRAMGCVNRGLDQLVSQIGPFLSNLSPTSGLSKDEIAQLKAHIPALMQRCQKLSQYNLRPTLVHGDLYKGNLTHQAGRIYIFDWAEGCIAHPFFDLLELYLEADIALQTRLRDAYLALWTDYEPMSRLLEAWHLAAPLCGLHIALSAHSIVEHLEPVYRSQLSHNMPRWLRVVLKML